VVQGASSLDPVDLVVGEGMPGGNHESLPGWLGDFERYLSGLVATKDGIETGSLYRILR
jgi:hypothetical protein